MIARSALDNLHRLAHSEGFGADQIQARSVYDLLHSSAIAGLVRKGQVWYINGRTWRVVEVEEASGEFLVLGQQKLIDGTWTATEVMGKAGDLVVGPRAELVSWGVPASTP